MVDEAYIDFTDPHEIYSLAAFLGELSNLVLPTHLLQNIRSDWATTRL
ncbi:hypothetical protein DSUL_60258 [Desulfovibrionales bacterium]